MVNNLPRKDIFRHKTPSRELEIEKFTTRISLENILVDNLKFSKLCENGCVNFGSKFSCPPFSPSFDFFSKGHKEIEVFFYRIFLHQYLDVKPFNRVKASNSILKSLLDRELYNYKIEGYKVVGSGSCRACKPCGAKEGRKCKKPEKLLYSLESLGVDVTKLVLDCFNITLQWYKKGYEHNFTSVVGGVLY